MPQELQDAGAVSLQGPVPRVQSPAPPAMLSVPRAQQLSPVPWMGWMGLRRAPMEQQCRRVLASVTAFPQHPEPLGPVPATLHEEG